MRATPTIPNTSTAATTSPAGAGAGIAAAPGVAVGAILWFSPHDRWKFKKVTLRVLIVAVAMIIICGYLDVRPGGGDG